MQPHERGARRKRRGGVAAAIAITWLAAAAGASTPTRTDTITEAEANPAAEWKPFDSYPVELFDIDGDGDQEIITLNDNRRVYVLDAENGRMLAELTTRFPDGWTARTINGVEAERMEPGAPASLIAANSAAYITRFDFDDANSTATDWKFKKRWEKRLAAHHPNPGMDAKVTLADANGNRKYEIYAQVEEMGLFALKGDGGILWSKNVSGGNAEAVLADWDRDGHLEAFFFSDNGQVRAYHALKGTHEWTFDATQYMPWPASISRGGAVAQLDDGRLEVVFCARDGRDDGNLTDNRLGLFVVDNDDADAWGDLRWLRRPAWAAPLCYARPVVYDFNGNGKPEIYGMDWNTVGHKPGNWERTGPAHVFSFTREGRELWHTTLDTWWSNKDIAIADLDGDGAKEVLANGPDDAGHDGWWMLSIRNGTKEAFLDVYPWKSTRGPRLGDLDGDGDVDFALPVEGDAGGTEAGEGAVQVWHVGTPLGSIAWGGAEDRYPKRYPFQVTFAPQGDSNEFYVKVKVTTYHKVVAAWFSEDGGAWQALDLLHRAPDWTLWDQAAEVPAGTEVRFKARDDLGKEMVSGPFPWPP